MDNIALLNLEGMGMAGTPGVAARVFGALYRVGISVILISKVGVKTVVVTYAVCFFLPEKACLFCCGDTQVSCWNKRRVHRIQRYII